MNKTCSKCGESKPATAEYFVSNKSRPDGFSGYCRFCDREYQKAYRAKNPDKIKAARNKWRETHIIVARERARISAKRRREINPQADRDMARRYRENNPERVLESQQLYRANNIDKIRRRDRERYWSDPQKARAQSLAWAKSNPEYRAANEHRRRARKASLPATLTPAEYQAILEFYGFACAYCGRADVKLTQDHIIPLSQGGSYTKENIVPACRHCNFSKGSRTPEQAGMKLRFMEKNIIDQF